MLSRYSRSMPLAAVVATDEIPEGKFSLQDITDKFSERELDEIAASGGNMAYGALRLRGGVYSVDYCVPTPAGEQWLKRTVGPATRTDLALGLLIQVVMTDIEVRQKSGIMLAVPKPALSIATRELAALGYDVRR